MSKFVKNLIIKELGEKLKDVEGLAVINPRGINATKTNLLRRKLHARKLRMTVVKNTLVRKATDSSHIKGFEVLLDGPSAVIYGDASVSAIARLLLEEKKADETLELRGAFFDGDVYAGDKGMKQISELPTREEAISNVLSALLGPGRKLAGAIKGPGGTIGALVKAIEEKAGKAEGAAPEAA